jgi:hypothetical protein
MLEYDCPRCGRFDSLERRAKIPATLPHCGSVAYRAISAPRVKTPLISVERGASAEPPPGALDTRDIRDGMPLTQWRRNRSVQRRREARDSLYKALKST